MTGLTYDSGALIAAERKDRRMWLLHRRALDRGVMPVVPAGVLAETWRNQPQVARLLSGCEVEALDELGARRTAALLSAVPGAGVVDASVVQGALGRGEAVVTSDRGDLLALAAAADRRLAVIDV